MRPILLFLFVALLAIVVLQNLTPSVALTFLGMQTVALPLAVWLLGAVLAGAMTTVLVATLIRFLGKGRSSPRRKAHRPSRRPSDPQGEPWTPPPWTGGWTKPLDPEPVDRAGNAPPPQDATWAAAEDDWEHPRSSNEWDDWEDAPRASTASSRTVIQDAPYREISPPIEPELADRERLYETAESAYQYRPYEADAAAESAYQYRPYEAYEVIEEPLASDDSASYRYRPYLDEEPEEEREIWDDWEEDPPAQPASSPAPEAPPAEPRRPIVEINREPETGYRAGTVYSYSYRRAEPDTPTDHINAPPDESPKASPQGSADAGSPDAGSTSPVSVDLGLADAATPGPPSFTGINSDDSPADSSPDLPPDSPSADSAKARSIYEADFRVIAPPSYPDDGPSDPVEVEGEEDWDEDDDSQRNRFANRPSNPYAKASSSEGGDPWDDENWGDGVDEPAVRRGSLDREIWDDWDDDEEERDQDGGSPRSRSGGSGRSPEGNPPLRLG